VVPSPLRRPGPGHQQLNAYRHQHVASCYGDTRASCTLERVLRSGVGHHPACQSSPPRPVASTRAFKRVGSYRSRFQACMLDSGATTGKPTGCSKHNRIHLDVSACLACPVRAWHQGRAWPVARNLFHSSGSELSRQRTKSRMLPPPPSSARRNTNCEPHESGQKT
jgi:hypothetical protein